MWYTLMFKYQCTQTILAAKEGGFIYSLLYAGYFKKDFTCPAVRDLTFKDC